MRNSLVILPLLWRGCIRLARKSLEGRRLRKRLGHVSHSTPPPEAGEVRCDPMGKVNFVPVPEFFPMHACSASWGDAVGERSGFALASEEQIISSWAVRTASWLLVTWAFLVFKYFHGLLKQMKALLHTPLLKNLCYSKHRTLCFLYLLSVGCLSGFFMQNLYSFRIGCILSNSVFRGLLYAFQQHLFYQHFLQHLLHITTTAMWFHLEECRIMYGKAVIAYLFAKYILLWKISSVALYSIKWCYFLFTFSTVNSFEKETMKIVYCPFHN